MEQFTQDFIEKANKAIGEQEIEIFFKKLDDRAVMPSYSHNGDVGMDMTAIDVEYNEEFDFYIYKTGLAFESPFHYGQLLFPRSSNRKTDVYLCNGVGIADIAIYRGEVIFCWKNRDSIDTIAEREANKAMMEYYNTTNVGLLFINSWLREGFEIYNKTKEKVYSDAKELKYAPYKVGDRVGQMVIVNYPQVKLTEKNILSETERGINGFGSTGN